jgi:hypothetical protein
VFSEEAATAYHEAGHAVAAFLLNRGPRKATITPDGEALGSVTDMGRAAEPSGGGGYWELAARARRRVDHAIIELMAGGTAEAHFLGRETYRDSGALARAASDHGEISDLMDELAWPSRRQGNGYLVFLEATTRDLIEGEAGWRLVEALAKALLDRKTLSASEVRNLLVRVGSAPRRASALPYAAR